MKKLIFACAACFCLLFPLAVQAQNEPVIKISMNGEVKSAKDISSGKGIAFTLPDISGNAYYIDSIELAVFEKQENAALWTIYKDEDGNESKKQLIQNPASLNFQIDFGNVDDYRDRAKYKLAYRYYVTSVDDTSKTLIAGQETKDGWRMVGETTPTEATDSGLTFYKNSTPSLSVQSISFDAQTINGIQTFSYSPEAIKNIWLPVDALQEGLAVQYSADDFDAEDNLAVSYILTDGINNRIVSEGELSGNEKITCDSIAQYFKLLLTVTDNWGATYEIEPIELMVDTEMPNVISEFSDMGRVLKGRNLYSKFTIMDNQNEALQSGAVYYTIRRNGTTLYQNIPLPNDPNGYYLVDLTGMSDGVYEIELSIFDKAHNKTTHILKQTLDNTAPALTFLTPQQNSDATVFSTWTNQRKKILIAATDEYAGVRLGYCYLNYAWQASTSLSPSSSYTFTFAVSPSMTGQLFYYFYIYDNAVTINKSTNSINTGSSGNYAFASKYVWLDMTAPSVTINADENAWYAAPTTIYASAYDYPSATGVSDNSGVKSTFYCITTDPDCDNNWKSYTGSGVSFSTGGVYYLHVKAIDFAGNETIVHKKIKINTPAEVTSGVEPTSDYWHTIYNQSGNLYVIKNTAYNTKYHFTVKDLDINDLIHTNIRLVNDDDGSIYSEASVDTASTGGTEREVIFNLSYTKADGSPLADGVYTMYISVSEEKNDGSRLDTIIDVEACQIVIKRNSPQEPMINVTDVSDGKKVTITYPDETLANSLNSSYIKSLYKREYKLIYDGEADTNRYNSYTVPLTPITKTCLVTAVYTDAAGNISTATKRIDASDTVSGIDVRKDGNTVTIEEGRPATTYYINTRRDKQSGINNDIFKSMQ